MYHMYVLCTDYGVRIYTVLRTQYTYIRSSVIVRLLNTKMALTSPARTAETGPIYSYLLFENHVIYVDATSTLEFEVCTYI